LGSPPHRRRTGRRGCHGGAALRPLSPVARRARRRGDLRCQYDRGAIVISSERASGILPPMPNIDHYAPGSFCWFELGTTDQNAAKSFYKALFGWDAMDLPMGPNDVYSMFMLDGRAAGAGYTLMPEMRAMGIPPHWAIYIAV